MNPRERFRRIMAYEPVDRLPVLAFEPYEPSSLERWRSEGLPKETQPEDFLGMAKLIRVPVNFGPIPAFEPKVLSEDAECTVEISGMGATIRRRKDDPTQFYGHIAHPIKTRRDWEDYRKRFRASSPGRVKDLPDMAQRLNASEDPVGLCIFPFFFRFCFYSMGMERFLTCFHEEPDLMHDVFAHVSDLALQTIHPVLDLVKLDFAMIAEDLAGKNGPLISPRTYREFWHPHQDPILRLLREHGVPIICQWSSGRFHQLLPEMLEHGFNCTWPLESMAGMDAVALRGQFGRNLRLGGNVPKEAVIAGPAAIDKAVARLMPLIREGGFIPALDDMTSPDMPFAHYRHLIEKLHAIRP